MRLLTSLYGRRREITYPVPTIAFLKPSPDMVMLFAPLRCIHPPCPVPPFLLMQNLSPKDITGGNNTKLKLSWRHTKPLVVNGLKSGEYTSCMGTIKKLSLFNNDFWMGSHWLRSPTNESSLLSVCGEIRIAARAFVSYLWCPYPKELQMR